MGIIGAVNPTNHALEISARMGVRAGQSFLDSGFWPRCPFRSEHERPVAEAWTKAVFATVGPVLGRGRRPRA